MRNPIQSSARDSLFLNESKPLTLVAEKSIDTNVTSETLKDMDLVRDEISLSLFNGRTGNLERILTDKSDGFGNVWIFNGNNDAGRINHGVIFINEIDSPIDITYVHMSEKGTVTLEPKSVYTWPYNNGWTRICAYTPTGVGGNTDIYSPLYSDIIKANSVLITESSKQVVVLSTYQPDGGSGGWPEVNIKIGNPSGYCPLSSLTISAVHQDGRIMHCYVNDFKDTLIGVIDIVNYMPDRVALSTLISYGVDNFNVTFDSQMDFSSFVSNVALNSEIVLTFNGTGLSNIEVELVDPNGAVLMGGNKQITSTPVITGRSPNIKFYRRTNEYDPVDDNVKKRNYHTSLSPGMDLIGATVMDEGGLVQTVLVGNLFERQYNGWGWYIELEDSSEINMSGGFEIYSGNWIYSMSNTSYANDMINDTYRYYDTDDVGGIYTDENGLYMTYGVITYADEDKYNNQIPEYYYGGTRLTLYKTFMTRQDGPDTTGFVTYSRLGPIFHTAYRLDGKWYVPTSTFEDSKFMKFVFDSIEGMPKIIDGFVGETEDFVSLPSIDNRDHVKYVELEVKNTDTTATLNVTPGDKSKKVISVKPGEQQYIKVYRTYRNFGFGPQIKMWYSSTPSVGHAEVSLSEIGIHNDAW